MDRKVLQSLSCGLYIICAKDDDRKVGCVVNTVTQATSKPATLTVCINKESYTNHCIKKTKEFSVSVLSESIERNTLAVFGFSSSRDKDKFSKVPHDLTPSGIPYIKEGVTGYIQCKVIEFVDNYTHTIFIAEVQEAEIILNEQGSYAPPMTYEYYHKVIKGKTPKNASSYVEEAKEPKPADAGQAPAASPYKCSVCGYIYPGSNEEFERLPDNYECPICLAAKSAFSK